MGGVQPLSAARLNHKLDLVVSLSLEDSNQATFPTLNYSTGLIENNLCRYEIYTDAGGLKAVSLGSEVSGTIW